MNLRLDQERKQVIQEMSVEREHHQRLVKEHGRLQQRMENLLEERNTNKSTHDISMHNSRDFWQVANDTRHAARVSSKLSGIGCHVDHSKQVAATNNGDGRHSTQVAVRGQNDAVVSDVGNSGNLTLPIPRGGYGGLLVRVISLLTGSKIANWAVFMLSPTVSGPPIKVNVDFGLNFKFESG